jgi:hypothetical protein
MQKFVTVNAYSLSIDDVFGLCSETVTLAVAQAIVLGDLGAARLATLQSALAALKARMGINRKSPLTAQIEALDKLRDGRFSDLRRFVKAATQSTTPATRAEGDALMQVLKPFWNTLDEPLASQTGQIRIFREHYLADAAALTAAGALNLATLIDDLFAGNDQLAALYDQRFAEEALIEGPSAESLKPPVVKSYDAFCDVVVQTLDALPSEAVQVLFNEMNELRRKYVARLPKDLGAGEHTVVEPIATQQYTEKAVTPLPKAYYREEGKPTTELVFAKDFSLTYKNNINVGTAEVTLHGKGAYKGRKTVTFNIAR